MSVEDNRVGPLYQHVFPPAMAPTLSFVGLPWKVRAERAAPSGRRRMRRCHVAMNLCCCVVLPASVHNRRALQRVAGLVLLWQAFNGNPALHCGPCSPCLQIIPFPQFELQSRWIAQVLAGSAALPSHQVRTGLLPLPITRSSPLGLLPSCPTWRPPAQGSCLVHDVPFVMSILVWLIFSTCPLQEMEQQTAQFYASLAAAGIPPRYTHRQSGDVQWCVLVQPL